MKTEKNDQVKGAVEDRVRDALEQSVEIIPGRVSDRLALARAEALKASRVGKDGHKGGKSNVVHFLPSIKSGPMLKAALSLAASIALVSTLWFYQLPQSSTGVPQVSQMEEESIPAGKDLTDDPAIELALALEFATLDDDSGDLVEDLEFAYWLALEDNTGV